MKTGKADSIKFINRDSFSPIGSISKNLTCSVLDLLSYLNSIIKPHGVGNCLAAVLFV